MARRAVDVTRLKRLYNRLRRSDGTPAPPPLTDATDEAVVGLLLRGSTEQKAARNLRRLKRAFVDYNEIRVTRTSEIEEAISPTPDAARKAKAVSLMLGALFDRFHRTSVEPIFELAKRDARKFLEKISSAAVAARVLLFSLGAHAVPADDAVRNALIAQRVTDESVDVGRLQTALERHLKSTDAYAFYRLVRDFADTQPAAPRRKEADTKKKVAKKKVAKKKSVTKTPKRKAAAVKKTARTKTKTSRRTKTAGRDRR